MSGFTPEVSSSHDASSNVNTNMNVAQTGQPSNTNVTATQVALYTLLDQISKPTEAAQSSQGTEGTSGDGTTTDGKDATIEGVGDQTSKGSRSGADSSGGGSSDEETSPQPQASGETDSSSSTAPTTTTSTTGSSGSASASTIFDTIKNRAASLSLAPSNQATASSNTKASEEIGKTTALNTNLLSSKLSQMTVEIKGGNLGLSQEAQASALSHIQNAANLTERLSNIQDMGGSAISAKNLETGILKEMTAAFQPIAHEMITNPKTFESIMKQIPHVNTADRGAIHFILDQVKNGKLQLPGIREHISSPTEAAAKTSTSATTEQSSIDTAKASVSATTEQPSSIDTAKASVSATTEQPSSIDTAKASVSAASTDSTLDSAPAANTLAMAIGSFMAQTSMSEVYMMEYTSANTQDSIAIGNTSVMTQQDILGTVLVDMQKIDEQVSKEEHKQKSEGLGMIIVTAVVVAVLVVVCAVQLGMDPATDIMLAMATVSLAGAITSYEGGSAWQKYTPMNELTSQLAVGLQKGFGMSQSEAQLTASIIIAFSMAAAGGAAASSEMLMGESAMEFDSAAQAASFIAKGTVVASTMTGTWSDAATVVINNVPMSSQNQMIVTCAFAVAGIAAGGYAGYSMATETAAKNVDLTAENLAQSQAATEESAETGMASAETPRTPMERFLGRTRGEARSGHANAGTQDNTSGTNQISDVDAQDTAQGSTPPEASPKNQGTAGTPAEEGDDYEGSDVGSMTTESGSIDTEAALAAVGMGASVLSDVAVNMQNKATSAGESATQAEQGATVERASASSQDSTLSTEKTSSTSTEGSGKAQGAAGAPGDAGEPSGTETTAQSRATARAMRQQSFEVAGFEVNVVKLQQALAVVQVAQGAVAAGYDISIGENLELQAKLVAEMAQQESVITVLKETAAAVQESANSANRAYSSMVAALNQAMGTTESQAVAGWAEEAQGLA